MATKADLEKLHKQIHLQQQKESTLKKQLKDSKQKIKVAQSDGIKKGALVEKQRQERLTAGLKKKLTLATSRIKQLEKGTTPQTEGLEFEENLYKRLKKEFPEDKIEHRALVAATDNGVRNVGIVVRCRFAAAAGIETSPTGTMRPPSKGCVRS